MGAITSLLAINGAITLINCLIKMRNWGFCHPYKVAVLTDSTMEDVDLIHSLNFIAILGHGMTFLQSI